MEERPFHHGNLRTVLLDQAEQVLRESGIDALSLRQLARDAGVSHGAPRSHFIDRTALIDALAERGFIQLADAMGDAASAEPTDYPGCLRAAAHAYVDFAVRNAALLDLMFAAKMAAPPASLLTAAERFFDTISDIMRRGVAAGVFAPGEIDRLTLLVSATMQGISTFVGAGRASGHQVDVLIDDAVTMFLGAALESEPK
jgi:AcrR family transcriptional regulator